MSLLFKTILIGFGVALAISLLVIVLPIKRFETQYKYVIPLIISIVALVTALIGTFKNELFPFDFRLIPGEVIFAVPTSPSHHSLQIVLALSFINEGYGQGVIEWIALKIKTKNTVKLYTPIAEIDYEKFLQGKRKLHAENIKGSFGPFTLGAREAVKKYILFSQEENNSKYPFNEWSEGDHKFEIWVKTSNEEKAKLVNTFKLKIDKKLLESYFSGNGAVIMIREIDI
jgi:hypothetical protein